MCLNPPRLFALIDIKSRQGDYFHWLFREQLVPHRPWDSVTPCQLDALQAPFYYLFYLRPHSMPHEHLVDCLDRFAVFAVSVFAMVLCSDDIYAQLSVLRWYHNFALIVQVPDFLIDWFTRVLIDIVNIEIVIASPAVCNASFGFRSYCILKC